jgi:hypothetical protein
MAKIDEISDFEEKSMDYPRSSDKEVHEEVHHDDEIHIPHVPLTGTQKLVCIAELILAGLLTVFVFSTIIRHIIELPGRIQ